MSDLGARRCRQRVARDHPDPAHSDAGRSDQGGGRTTIVFSHISRSDSGVAGSRLLNAYR